jgi:hypothetical protein
MDILKICLIALIAALAPMAAEAQYPEIRNTPRAKLAGVEIGVWVVYSQIGFTMIAAEKQSDGNWYALATTEPYLSLGDFEAAVSNAGGVESWIEKQMPTLNGALERRFQTVAASKEGKDAKPLPLIDQVNATLMGSYRIVVGTDGIPRLVKK